MNAEKQKTNGKKIAVRSAKECTYIAVFVALVIAAQLAFATVPGVEVVTVLFVSFSFALGIARGCLAATAFSTLRQVVFGADLKILALYLVYYNFLSAVFGLLGKAVKKPHRKLFWIVLIACVCTVIFTLLDNVLTPLWYGYNEKGARLYFQYSLPVLIPQTVCTAITVALLFLPLWKIFSLCVKK